MDLPGGSELEVHLYVKVSPVQRRINNPEAWRAGWVESWLSSECKVSSAPPN